MIPMKSAGGILTIALGLAVATPALAAAAKLLGTHGAWEAYAYTEKGGKVCYIASAPKSSENSAKDRGGPYVSVTHRPGEKSVDVVGVFAGYAYQKGSEVEVEIDGGTKFKLFTSGDGAWMADAKGDKALAEAMAKGNQMVVRGTPAKGKKTVDTYSLAGFTASRSAINKACGIK